MAMGSRFRILNRPDECLTCSLNSVATGFSEPEGTCANGVLAVGESLGWNEAVDGYPFRPYAQAGAVLEKAFKKAGYPRKSFGLWNICACRPPGDSLTGWESAMYHCRVHFRRVVARFRPRVILALGAIPLRSLTLMAGDKQNLEMVRGYPLWCEEFRVWVVSTYHPSFIARGAWNVLPVLVRDIKAAVAYARDGVPEPKLEYIEDGTERHMDAMFEELQDCPDLPLSLDIEDDSLIKKANKITGPPEVTQINVSTRECAGLVVMPTQENLATFRRMCALPNPKVGQNLFLYDIPEMEKNYQFLFNGRIEDVMWMFHHLYPDLPMKRSKKDADDEGSGVETDSSELSSIANLQYIASFSGFPFPWKHHKGARPGYYGCCDVDAPLRAFWWMTGEMEALGVLESYYALVADLMTCLRGMRLRGIPASRQKLTALHAWLTGEVTTETAKIQVIVPDVVRISKPARGYKKIPKSTAGLVLRTFDIPGNPSTRCKCFRVRKRRKTDQTAFAFLEYAESDYAQWTEKPDGSRVLRAPDVDCPVCSGVGSFEVIAHKEDRWAKLVPFNVGSPTQMWAYARFKKYHVPMNSSREYAMDQETIAKLAKSTKDPLYVTADRIRRLDKLDGTYAVGWLNALEADECVHPQVGYYPSIGQLSSRRPNSQNAPNEAKNPELAPLFRDAIEAPDGRVIYEADYKTFHAQTLGYEAACPTFIRLAKLDLHTYFAVQVLKVPGYETCLALPDAELKAWLTYQRKNYTLKNGMLLGVYRNAKAKHAVLGYGNGLQAGKMFRQYPEAFENQREAQYIISMLDGVFPEIAEFHKLMPLQANRGVQLTNEGPRLIKRADGSEETNAVITRYNCIRWFYNIRKYDFKRKEVVHGEDWERALSFAHTNDAHSHMKLAMRRLEDSGANEKFWLANQIHDALICLPLKRDLEECHYVVSGEMQKASEVMLMHWDGMRGLQVDVEAKVGQTWSTMKEFTG